MRSQKPEITVYRDLFECSPYSHIHFKSMLTLTIQPYIPHHVYYVSQATFPKTKVMYAFRILTICAPPQLILINLVTVKA